MPGARHAAGLATRVADRIARRCGPVPRLGMILGSGFGPVQSACQEEVSFRYDELEAFPRPGVTGHAGRLVVGRLAGTPVVLLAGRAHFYEGYSLAQVTFPVRVLAALGIERLLITNAAGGLNPRFRPGDFMVVEDHFNFMGDHPLRGPAGLAGERFVDLTAVYDAGLRVQRGVYLAVAGPSYETPAEIRAFRRLGADAVGMSSVPEAIVARQCGLCVAGLSCITNLAAGRSGRPLCHAEVLAAAGRAGPNAVRLIGGFVRRATAV
jgi:purine-nucleoside phosphorylase